MTRLDATQAHRLTALPLTELGTPRPVILFNGNAYLLEPYVGPDAAPKLTCLNTETDGATLLTQINSCGGGAPIVHLIS
jgi:hypothetical protein